MSSFVHTSQNTGLNTAHFKELNNITFYQFMLLERSRNAKLITIYVMLHEPA